MAFAEELHTALPAGSQSSIRRGRKPRAASSAKPAKSDAGIECDQEQHSRCDAPLKACYPLPSPAWRLSLQNPLVL